MNNNNVLLIAGEASGDLHGSLLVKELLALDPTYRFFGIGGPLLQRQGMSILVHNSEMAFMGFWEVIKHLNKISKVFRAILDIVSEKQITTVILIDYPGFNLRLAKKLKKRGLQIIYYISPQLWAWGQKRVKIIRNCVDLLIVILPFEVDFYRRFGITAHFVGHPLLDQLNHTEFTASFRQKYQIPPTAYCINLQPGSRIHEVEQLMPLYIKVMEDVKDPDIHWLIPQANTIPPEYWQLVPLGSEGNRHLISTEDYYNALATTSAVITASGTAVLEAAIFTRPMAIVYRVNPLTYYIARQLIKVPYIGIVNLIAGKKIVPEFIQREANTTNLVEFIHTIRGQHDLYQDTCRALIEVRKQLGEPGAAIRAANLIFQFQQDSSHALS